jgi:hypothetical protein
VLLDYFQIIVGTLDVRYAALCHICFEARGFPKEAEDIGNGLKFIFSWSKKEDDIICIYE